MSYHPFKMHGSYIGLVIGFVVSYMALVGFAMDFKIGSLGLSSYLIIFAPLVIGFLLGWSMHSLIRVTRK